MKSQVFYLAMWLVIIGLAIGLVVIVKSITFFRKKMREDPLLCAQCKQQLQFLGMAKQILWTFILILLTCGLLAMYVDFSSNQKKMLAQRQRLWPNFDKQKIWTAPDEYLAKTDAEADLIHYGRDLIAHTQDYFGENGTIRTHSINAMNCQNCHLEAGSKPFGNNYAAVQSMYPQMRARSGALETIPKRINDCFQRSLNGQPLDTTSREMQAMLAYMRWLGTAVPKGDKPKGAGLVDVPFLDRAADPNKGQKIYVEKCISCHGLNGEGLQMSDSPRKYPPLWGNQSYNEAAGLFRISRFAGYVKVNMPFGATYLNPLLSDEEAWDVAAFVNSQPRPKHPFLDLDWPKIEKKPFDHPFGPYKDAFSEAQHKFGPFGEIVAFYKK
jgi:thiosulfate dehydrogenase